MIEFPITGFPVTIVSCGDFETSLSIDFQGILSPVERHKKSYVHRRTKSVRWRLRPTNVLIEFRCYEVNLFLIRIEIFVIRFDYENCDYQVVSNNEHN